ncbi:hypothetical protein G6F31_015829 [Rhizopus arrhizus]|nr:hypothetical protein G6F31_015829 [Rhizopus arrhizus]
MAGRPFIRLDGVRHLFHAALVHHHDAVRQRQRFGLVVRHQNGGGADRALDAAQFQLHFLAQLGIQIGQRFVQQQHAGPDDQRARQRHALLLPTGHARRMAVRQMRQAHQLQRVSHARLAFIFLHPLHLQADRHGLGGGHEREQRVVLEHQAQAALVRRHAADVAAIQHDAAAGGFDKTRDHLQGGRLAAARRPQQGNELAPVHRQAQRFDGGRVAVAFGEAVQH